MTAANGPPIPAVLRLVQSVVLGRWSTSVEALYPERAVKELVRVVRPMSPVILCQLASNAEFDAAAQEMVVERLGLRPRRIVEWKRLLREAGVVEIEVQDWTDSAGARAAAQNAPIPQLRWSEKMSIVSRAWRRHGLRVARGAVEREVALLREPSRERAIGFQVIKGVKWPHPKTS